MAWLENNDAPVFAQLQVWYNVLLDDKPQGFAELIEDHYESDEAWPMIFLA